MTEAKFMAIQRMLYVINNPGDIEAQVKSIVDDYEQEIRAELTAEIMAKNPQFMVTT